MCGIAVVCVNKIWVVCSSETQLYQLRCLLIIN